MKMNSVKPGKWRSALGRWAGVSALVLLGMSASGQALPKSPVGTWDCNMSGAREGLAVMSFFADGTFENDEIIVPKPAHVPKSDPRDAAGGDGRDSGSGSAGTSLPEHTDVFGWQSAMGQWGFDIRGRVIGSFYEIGPPTYATNALTPSSTNLDVNFYPAAQTNATAPDEYCVTLTVGTNISVNMFTNVTTCYAITADAVTNRLSFVGTVAPNKRLTLLVTSPAGKVNFNGLPDSPQADLSGNWYGVEHDQSLWYTEFFTLSPLLGSANIYTVDGSGPGYLFSGMAILTPQKKLAIATGSVSTFGASSEQPVLVRSVVGPFNPRKFSGKTHGLRDPITGDISRITYSVQHQ